METCEAELAWVHVRKEASSRCCYICGCIETRRLVVTAICADLGLWEREKAKSMFWNTHPSS